MNADDSTALDLYYQQASEKAREFVTLVKTAEQHGPDADPGGHIVRGQIRQWSNEATDLQRWLMVEVLARAVAATYDDLDDWSQSVLEAIASEGSGQ